MSDDKFRPLSRAAYVPFYLIKVKDKQEIKAGLAYLQSN